MSLETKIFWGYRAPDFNYIDAMNKSILITGANRGIGKEIARQLAAQGHTIFLGSRDLAKGEAVAAEIEGNVIPIAVDVTNQSSLTLAATKIREHTEYLDVVVNNAGIISSGDGLATASPDEIRQVWNVNVLGPIQVVQAMLSLLKKSDEPRIINMSSQMGGWKELEAGNYAGYRLSKASLNAVTVLLDNELPDVFLACMHPGWIKTDMGGEEAPLSVKEGADTAVYLSTEAGLPSGKFWHLRAQRDF